MKLNKVANNVTELSLACGTVVLFSYNTPVAAMLPSGRYVRTTEKYSQTTTKHINKWLEAIGNVEEVQQSFIDGMVA